MKKRTFETVMNGEKVTLSVVKPTLAQSNEADKVYTRAKIRLLRLPEDQRPFPQSAVRTKLKESGVWSDEQDKELRKVDDRIATLEKILETGEREEDGVPVKLKKLEGRAVALELLVLRYSKFGMLEEITRFAQDITLERIAEREQLDYLVSVCTLDKDNRKVFKSIEDYQGYPYEEGVNQVSVDARVALESHLAGEVPDWRADLIEYKFLKQYGFMDEKYRLVDAKGRLCDADFALINEDGAYINEDGSLKENVATEVGTFLDD